MSSLRELVEKNGFGIRIDNEHTFEFGSNPFVVVGELECHYAVRYDNTGIELKILKECEYTNDYEIV
jgi:hypothetical protein